jgi:DNA-binding HxlR family transcriptional regulator
MKKKINEVTGVSHVLEDVLGCKWTVIVLEKIASGIHRPGALSKSTSGLTVKVLNERLRKLLRYKIISRKVFSEIPPKVEYRITPLGRRFSKIIEQLKDLEEELLD